MERAMISPIPTRYKGYHFRSRLEARWAVFFDGVGTGWEYEAEGYALGAGNSYLPDFKLLGYERDMDYGPELFAECKPEAYNKTQLEKPENFSRCSGAKVIILAGPPPEPAMWHRSYLILGVSRWDDFALQEFRSHSTSGLVPVDQLMGALQAARSARFEFGDSGPT